MPPEKEQGAGKERGHENERPEKGRITLPIAVIGMGLVIHKSGIETRMAATAVINQVERVDAGAGVLFWKNIMRGVTVRASGHPRRITDILDLPVIGLFIIGHDVRGEAISLHHGAVAVAVFAFLIVKFSCLCRVLL
jgi:hypothetical protein